MPESNTMAGKKRVKVQAAVETAVLTKSRRRCCLCFGLHANLRRRQGQIAHIDHNSANNAEDNLAYLCVRHHNEHDSKTRLVKGLTEREVKHHRDKLYEHIEKNPDCLKRSRVTRTLELIDLSFLEDGNERWIPPSWRSLATGPDGQVLLEKWLSGTAPVAGELPIVDIKLRNPSREVVVLISASFAVKKVWRIEPVKINKTSLEISDDYDTFFQDKEPPYIQSVPLSQKIPANDADRFVLTLRPAIADRIILAALELSYNSGAILHCGDILFAMKGTGQWFRTATAEKIKAERNKITKTKLKNNTAVKTELSQIQAVTSKVVRAFLTGKL